MDVYPFLPLAKRDAFTGTRVYPFFDTLAPLEAFDQLNQIVDAPARATTGQVLVAGTPPRYLTATPISRRVLTVP